MKHLSFPLPPAGFSVLEAMVALATSSLIAASLVAAFAGAIEQQARNKHRWVAFTLAQQRMELLAAAPVHAAQLQENSTTTTPGAEADRTCDDVASGPRHLWLREDGTVAADGVYELCWKVTNNVPIAGLKNVRVVVTHPDGKARSHVFLQTLR